MTSRHRFHWHDPRSVLRALAAAALGAWLLLSSGIAAVADYRETVDVLRIGILASHPAARDPAKLETVRDAYSQAIGIPVDIITFPDQAALIDAHVSARVTYALHTARSFAVAEGACGCVSALRSPVAPDGQTGFRSVMVVRDAVQKPVAELEIAFPGRASVSGYVIPMQAMEAGSLDTPVLIEAAGTSDLLRLMETQEADGFFGWVAEPARETGGGMPLLFQSWSEDRIAALGPLRILWSSEPVPFGPHAIHQSIPDDLAAALGDFLDTLPEKAPGLLDLVDPVHGGGFFKPAPDAYRVLRPTARRVVPSGNDLAGFGG